MKPRLVCFVPSDRAVGGIAKLLDYAVHGSRAGHPVVFCCQSMRMGRDESLLFKKPYFLRYGGSVEVCSIKELEPRPDDIVLFTLPSSHAVLSGHYAAAGILKPDFIHLLQNVRVANTAFDGGYSYRLLPKPMHRICITQEVYDAAAPLVEDQERLVIVPHGFDFDAFARPPERDDPVMIAYNTFKGDFGDIVAERYHDDPRVAEIRVSGKGISWTNLQANYAAASIFLSTPLIEEGLYLPALEAMAAGHAVITPDAFGNRFYCDFDENCCLVAFETVEAYHAKIEWLIDNWQDFGFEMRKRAYQKAAGLGLDGEFKLFAEKLITVGHL